MEDFPYHLWGESLKKCTFAEKSDNVATITGNVTPPRSAILVLITPIPYGDSPPLKEGECRVRWGCCE